MTRLHSSRIRLMALSAAVVCLAAGAIADGQSGLKATDRKTIEHVLNRLGFGARPGDVERVRAMGIEAYIDAQLHPERIVDSALDVRLQAFPTLSMSTEELNEKYFRPADEARRAAQAAQGAQAGRNPAAAAPGRGPAPASPRRPAEGDQMRPDGDPSMQGDPNMAPAPAGRATVPAAVAQAAVGQRLVMNDLMQAKMLRAATSERQLQEVLVDFWFNHFNVFVGKGQVRQYLTEYERDVIRPHTLGSFRELLGAVAHSPAMLFYLDNFQSSTPTPPIPPQLLERLNDARLTPEMRRRLEDRVRQQRMQQPQRQQRGINENYARELMELHTLGVDGGYTQQDVTELARILTGWTIDQPRNGGRFIFRDAMHDTGTKVFLGKTFGSAGAMEGERALDMLAAHPSTAHFISFKLAQRFIADAPPASVVDRAAQVFTSTKGDLRAVVRAIVTSPEFFAAAAYRAKVKTPLEFVVSSVRATGATIVNPQPMVVAMQNLGMPLYGAQPPTGYSMTADAWVNTGSLLNRLTFAAALVDGGRITPAAQPGRGAQADRQPNAMDQAQARGRGARPAARGNQAGARGRGALARGPIHVDVRTLAPDTSEAARDQIVKALLGGEASEATQRTLARAETPENLIALALGSPEFQRR